MKILAFDSWTEGSVHLERLVEAFQERKLDLSLLHIGSWGHDVGRPNEEHIGPLLVRDVAYYGGLSFAEILEREAPDAVLFLSLTAFAHRAFNRYCGYMGIPTIHLYHGLITVQRIDVPRSCPINIRRQIALAAERLPKNILRLWPRYAKSLWDTNAGMEDWAWFGRDLWSKAVATSFSGLAAPDASTDVCCVYTEADVAHAVQRYRVSPSSVAVVGNPDLALMGLSETDFGAALLNEHDKKPDVLYVDSALIEGGAVFDSADDFIQHLVTTAESLARAGLRLVVKPHPVHFRSDVPERLRQHGVDLCTNADFLDLLRTARGCIVEPSSAAVIPALCGAPILLAQYGKLAQQEYGAVLTSYPRTRHLKALADVTELLDDLKNSVDGSKVRAWISVNAGPLPFRDMPGRVAEVCASLVRRRVVLPEP